MDFISHILLNKTVLDQWSLFSILPDLPLIALKISDLRTNSFKAVLLDHQPKTKNISDSTCLRLSALLHNPLLISVAIIFSIPAFLALILHIGIDIVTHSKKMFFWPFSCYECRGIIDWESYGAWKYLIWIAVGLWLTIRKFCS